MIKKRIKTTTHKIHLVSLHSWENLKHGLHEYAKSVWMLMSFQVFPQHPSVISVLKLYHLVRCRHPKAGMGFSGNCFHHFGIGRAQWLSMGISSIYSLLPALFDTSVKSMSPSRPNSCFDRDLGALLVADCLQPNQLPKRHPDSLQKDAKRSFSLTN